MSDNIKRIGELQLLVDKGESDIDEVNQTIGVAVAENQIEIGIHSIAWASTQKLKGQKLAEVMTPLLADLKDSSGKPIYQFNKKGICNKINHIRAFCTSDKVRETFQRNSSFESISKTLTELELDSWSKMQKWAKDKAPETLDEKAWKIVEQMNDKDHQALDRFIGKMCSTFNLLDEEGAEALAKQINKVS